jgi:hypothetical protein
VTGVEAARQQQLCAVCRRINEKFPACIATLDGS